MSSIVFDVLDILVPKLSLDAGVAVRQHHTAFGPSDEWIVYVDGVRFARMARARDAYSDLEVWTGALGRADWTVLLTASEANVAATTDAPWARFLNAFVMVLSANPGWLVTCESDCDQHPREKLHLSPERLVQLLDSHRRMGFRPISLQASAA